MAPDLERMLSECDGALMIGDRALLESIANPKLVIMDLGAEWTSMTGLPMVFGVFAARKDTDTSVLAKAHSEMLYQLDRFDNDLTWRLQVITNASISTGLSETRLDNYYRSEVWNRLDEDALRGLDMYLKQVCGCSEGAEWANLD